MSVPDLPDHLEYPQLVPQFIPTSDKVSDLMLKLLDLKPFQVLLEPGSGDARNLIKAAQKYGCRGIGYEISKVLVEESRKKIEETDLGGLIEIVQDTYMNADLSKADGIFIYLYPSDMDKIEQKALEEGKEGLKIVSNTFSLPNLKPGKVDNSAGYKVYYYELKPRQVQLGQS